MEQVSRPKIHGVRHSFITIVRPSGDALAARHAIRGVTLFEMVVVMGVAAILMAIAIPSYKYVTNSNRIAAEGNGLLGDLQFARAEAIKEGLTVSTCVSTNGTNCSTNNYTWSNGWIVFSDLNRNGNIDAGDTVFRVQAAFNGTDTFVSNNVGIISFNREGFAAGLAGGTLITLHATPASNASTRCLNVTMVGMMGIQTYGNPCL